MDGNPERVAKQMKSGYDELRDLIRKLFEKELLEAESKGYLILYRGIYYDRHEKQLIAEVDFVKEEIVYPMRLNKIGHKWPGEN
jgi:hypothetical protein